MRAPAQSLDEIRLGDERAAEADEVGEVLRARLDGELQVVAVVGHVEAVEGVAQLLQVEAAGRMALAARVALDDVDIGEVNGLICSISAGRRSG